MIFPPILMRIRRVAPGKKNLNVWIPLFIVWPVATVIWLVLLPLLAILALALRRTRLARPILLAWPAMLLLLCRARGLRVELKHKGQELLVYVI